MKLRRGPDGTATVVAAGYRLDIDAAGRFAAVSDTAGRRWATLRLLAAVDATDGVDETLAVEAPEYVEQERLQVRIRRRSSRWDDASVDLELSEDEIEVSAAVRGHGRLAEVTLLGGRRVAPGPMGLLPSGRDFVTLFSPNPGDPARLRQSAGEPARVGVVGDAEPGRGQWFFTPAPLCFAVSRDDAPADDGDWMTIAVAAPVTELPFTEAQYRPSDGGFDLALDYQGHTTVDGAFRTPSVLLTPGVRDEYEGLRRHRQALVARSAAPPVSTRDAPAWWSEPMFCGWGAQSYVASTTGSPTPHACTQANYDGFLRSLAAEGITPGTVVIDDKWQQAYGTGIPDAAKWPDLRRWIADRHAAGQRVLLWWKAWDAEGLAAEACVRSADGTPLGVDPTSTSGRRLLSDSITRALAPDGLGADGLKIDFTARTPSGYSAVAAGRRWGISLLHELLRVTYATAKSVRPDALVITHTPHPGFVDVTDMLRLNDMLRLDDPHQPVSVVPQMLQRAQIVAAACPEVLVDTDDWCALDRADWRRYLAVKPELGVPALYYATHLDRTGEPLRPADYAAILDSWADWSRRRDTAKRMGKDGAAKAKT